MKNKYKEYLRSAISDALQIKALWLLDGEGKEQYKNEAQALLNMLKSFEACLK